MADESLPFYPPVQSLDPAPIYPPGQVRMTPSGGYTLGETVLGGARLGARGASVMGAPVRGGAASFGGPAALSPLTEVDLGGGRRVIVGGRTYKDLADAMVVNEYVPKNPSAGGKALTVHLPGMRSHQPLSHRVDPDRLVVTHSSLPKGVARGQETGFTAYLRGLKEAQERGLGYQSDTSLNSMSRRVYKKLQEKGVPFTERASGFDLIESLEASLAGRPVQEPGFRFRISPEELAKVDLDEIMTSGGPASIAHVAERVAKPSMLSRLGSGLKTGIKGALTPANIVKDALYGTVVGGLSAGAGHLAGRPTSAGRLSLSPDSALFNEIDSGGVIDQATLLRAIEAAGRKKEALRQSYIDEINARQWHGYPDNKVTVAPGARIEEISDYLGPVRWP